MGKKQSRKLVAATEAFGELPPNVLALGKPLSVHPLGSLGKTITPAQTRLGLYTLATFLFLLAVGCAGMFLAGKPLGNANPDVWLAITLPSLVVGALFGWFGWLAGRPESADDDRATVRGLVIYPDAIVRATTDGFDVIRWDEMSELHSPSVKSGWTVVAADGRRITLPGWVADHTEAIIQICKSAETVLLPRYLAELEAGKKVMFGEFGVSRRFVYFKGDKLGWDEVTDLKAVNGSLVISRGKLLPWCYHNPLSAPNGLVAGELVNRVAPKRLLVDADPSARRW